MQVAVLALQGAFIEHEHALSDIGVESFEIREAGDLKRDFDGLVLPGGESTVQGKLLKDLALFSPLKERIEEGLPVLATCAGLILLAERLENDSTVWFGTLPVTVRRNAYGRQLGSFHAEGRWEEGAKGTEEAAGATCVADEKNHSSSSATLASEPVLLTFIRAPRIEATGPGVEPLVTLNDAPVAVRHRNQIAAAFHPELDDDNRLYEAFLAPLKRAY